MKGLIIKEPWIDLILSGDKVWEIRGSNTKIRGKIALIKSGSGKVFGTIDLIDSKELLLETYKNSEEYHRIKGLKDSLPYPRTYAWVLENPILLEEPLHYNHPRGCIIWVNLGELLDGI